MSDACKRKGLFPKMYLQNVSAKGTILSLRQFLAAESPLKMMKNAFYFTLKALHVLKIFIVLY